MPINHHGVPPSTAAAVTPWARRMGGIGLLVLLLLSIGRTVAVGQRPARAAGCAQSGCDGKWPRDMGCVNGSVAVAWLPIEWGEDPPYMQGGGQLRFSPQCRAVYAEFTFQRMELRYFNPQVWRMPQYGGTKDARLILTEFQPVDGVWDASPGEILQSQLLDWSYSVRLCLHEDESNPFYDPETTDLPGSSPGWNCTEWQ